MASEMAKLEAMRQATNNYNCNGSSDPRALAKLKAMIAQVVGEMAPGAACGCPPQYAKTPPAQLPPIFQRHRPGDCPDRMGGSPYEAKARVAYTRFAGRAHGGIDQRIPFSIAVTAGDPTVSVTSGEVALPTTDQIVTKTRGLAITKLTAIAVASGDGAGAYSESFWNQNAEVIVRQGGDLLYQNSFFKFLYNAAGNVLGFDVGIKPEPADFSGVTFEVSGQTLTDGQDDYTLSGFLIAQWS